MSKRIRYTKSNTFSGVARNTRGTPMQCKQFNTEATAPAKAHKPKLWGYHKPKNAKPSLCIVSNAQGITIRIVKSVRVR
jgi:hypothetical protein